MKSQSLSTPPSGSPWGSIQNKVEVIDGVWFASTASHGGLWLNRERKSQMPEDLRNEKNQWYEEDCEASLVIWAFKEEWPSKKSVRSAKVSIKNWYPGLSRTLFKGEL